MPTFNLGDTMSTRPIKIAQFGGGVFLRGFFDWMLQKANDAHVYDGDALMIRSKTLGADPLAENNYRYTHISRDGRRARDKYASRSVAIMLPAMESTWVIS